MKEFDARWIGWAGVNVPDDIGQRALTNALAEKVLESWSGVPIHDVNRILIKFYPSAKYMNT